MVFVSSLGLVARGGPLKGEILNEEVEEVEEDPSGLRIRTDGLRLYRPFAIFRIPSRAEAAEPVLPYIFTMISASSSSALTRVSLGQTYPSIGVLRDALDGCRPLLTDDVGAWYGPCPR